MKTTFTIIILIVLLVLAGLYFQTDNTEPESEPENGGIDTADWQTYTNEEFGFTLQYPPEWEVYEGIDDPITPKINIYAPESDTSRLPFDHHSPDATHVSVFPEGIPTEGIFGESEASAVEFQATTTNARDFTLSGGEVWATITNVAESPTSWNESGFLFAGLIIEDHEIECFRDGEPVPDEQCDPLTGDQIVHHGSIDEEDREIQEEILSSFRFLEDE